MDQALAAHGLSLAKLSVLRYLIEAGEPLPLGRLAERMECVKSNITQLVDRLEADGLVRRLSDAQDRRSVLAAITSEGRRRYTLGIEDEAMVEQRLLARLSTQEQEQLVALLARLR